MRSVLLVLILLGIVAATATGIIISYQSNNLSNNSLASRTIEGTKSVPTTTTDRSVSTSSVIFSTTTSQDSLSTLNSAMATIPEPINTPQDLFGNFSQLALQFSVINASTSTNATFSFAVVGHPVINGTRMTEVKYQISSGENITTATIYYDRNYTAEIVSIGGQNLTGLIGMVGQTFLIAFTEIFPTIETQFGLNSTLLSNFQVRGMESENFGNLNMEVTTYSATNLEYSGAVIKNATISIGRVSGTNLSMMTYLHSDSIENGSEYQVTFGLISGTSA